MDIRTKIAVPGYLSRAPQLKHLADGVPLFIRQLGQKHYRGENNGSLTFLGTTYVKLVMFGEEAEAAFHDFITGDDVIAMGDFKTRNYEHQGRTVSERQFQAGKIVFDTTRHRYTVERAPRTVVTSGRSPSRSSTAVDFRAAMVGR